MNSTNSIWTSCTPDASESSKLKVLTTHAQYCIDNNKRNYKPRVVESITVSRTFSNSK